MPIFFCLLLWGLQKVINNGALAGGARCCWGWQPGVRAPPTVLQTTCSAPPGRLLHVLICSVVPLCPAALDTWDNQVGFVFLCSGCVQGLNAASRALHAANMAVLTLLATCGAVRLCVSDMQG